MAAGVPAVGDLAGPRFEHFHMVIQAAVAGLGLALMPEFLVREELDNGRLLAPFDLSIPSHHAYYVVYPEEKESTFAVRAFRDWILTASGNTPVGKVIGENQQGDMALASA